MTAFDFVVVGAGMAGASAAHVLLSQGSVLLLEQEPAPGTHATGRSAALFSEIYGNRQVRALSRASRAFLEAPPEGFCETPLLSGRGAMFFADEADGWRLEAMRRDAEPAGALHTLSAEEALGRVPILRPDAVSQAVLEPGAMDIDVDALHQGYLRALRRGGATLLTEARLVYARRGGGRWTLDTTAGVFEGQVLINAAGAWADQVAACAGAAPVGLTPKRRTAVLVDGPALDFASWPLVIDAAETVYFKPDAGRLLVSPADETDCEPCDAQPDEWDVAVAIDRFETVTSLAVRRVAHRWAGLRTFAPDRTPVCGFDPRCEGFFWLAGQGGYGIQTAPALARLTAALIAGAPTEAEIDPAELSPARFAILS